MKKIFLVAFTVLLAFAALAQPANYYNTTNGLTGEPLKMALHDIIKGHTSITYAQLWDAFWSTDNKGDGIVWDMYSDIPGGTPAYQFQMVVDQCGNYSGEGDCYNREHSWPQSWFNNDAIARTDLHHIFPVDGYVNNKRSNYPYGEVKSTKWTSTNGSKLGPSNTPGYSGTVFEPIDEYKGDFARAMLYMSVRYYGEDAAWKNSDMADKSVLKPWAIDLLLRWNKQDPVSQKEKDRNNVIYEDYQHNRNPFVDDPEFADRIWDPNWTGMAEPELPAIMVYPNPVLQGGVVHLDINNDRINQLQISDLFGKIVFRGPVAETISLPEGLSCGCYCLQLLQEGHVVTNMRLLIN